MSDNIATYSFLPWLRQGIANKIIAGSTSGARATIPVKLKINGKGLDGADVPFPLQKNISLYGPGDIIGIDSRSIVKNEPREWITNFESNYMPYIEFYDEDFPWRYSPTAVENDRLTPWLTLVVLKEDEFKKSANLNNRPLSYINVSNAAAIFQPSSQLWAWAHVHVNESVIDPEEKIVATVGDVAGVLSKLKTVLDKNPDLAYSRIMCPRKLQPNTAYHAFLIPSFESGRLAGLGLDPSVTPTVDHSAWQNYGTKLDPTLYPIYHEWFFKTGSMGDFEYLVRLLKAKPIDSRVGTRDMDVQHPGVNVSGISNPDLKGVLKLGGALRIPFDTLGIEDKKIVTKYDRWDEEPYPHQFQKDLSAFINLSDEYYSKTSADANADSGLGLDPNINDDDKDPLVTAPLYGRWHALMQRILKNNDGLDLPNYKNWMHELNLDPRFRVAAGFGTQVIQKNQEKYMTAAWKQVGDILEGNRLIFFAQLSKEVSWVWYDKHLRPMFKNNIDKAFTFSAPVHSRIMTNNFTVRHTIKESIVPLVMTSTVMRRILRPGSRLMKNLPFDGEIKKDNLIGRINNGYVLPAPEKVVPPTVPTIQDLADVVSVVKVPTFIADLILKYRYIKWFFLVLFLLFLLLWLTISMGWLLSVICLVAAITFGVLFYLTYKHTDEVIQDDSLNEENITPEAVDILHQSPNFNLTPVDSGFTPKFGDSDSVEAILFKEALRDAFGVINVSRNLGRVKKKPRLDLISLVKTTFDTINPEVTIPNLIYNRLTIPRRIKDQLPERFVPAMTYPEFDVPMYKPLKEISDELFLPNINFIANNSISLLETNQKFIEAYMVGLNHEFARELLWREYPTDQRGSYFRQFWDVSSCLPEKGLTNLELKEKLKDIPPIHLWSKKTELGDHDHREVPGAKEEEVVLVIRGELLKKYPSAVIYAHKAKWHYKDGVVDFNVERELALLSEDEKKNPPKTLVKTPLYEAKVDPDITFFGFDLTSKEVRGGTGDAPDDENKPGWFFIIKERPGEPRFGLDIDSADADPIDVWNDFSWNRASPSGNFLEINSSTPTITIGDFNATTEQEKAEQNPEDKKVVWSPNMNSAELAYILYQVPVMVAVHASEMLPKP